jgi:hypothetical protein
MSSVKVYLKSKNKVPINTDTLEFKVNNSDSAVGNWRAPDTITDSNSPHNIKEGEVILSDNPSSPIRNWTIDAGAEGLDSEKLDDILILIGI